MKIFQEKRRVRSLIFSKLVLFILFVIALVLLTSAGKMAFRAWQVSRESTKVEKELEELKERKAAFEEKINRLQSPTGIEKEAKERFNVKSPGEEVLIILEPRGLSATSSKATSTNPFIEFFRGFYQ